MEFIRHHRTYEAIKRFAAWKGLNSKTNSKIWSEEEDNIIVTHYATSTPEELEALLPGRKYVNICHRAAKLKIRKPSKEFSSEEQQIIIDNVAKMTYTELATLLPGRSVTTIKSWANTHGYYNIKSVNKQIIERQVQELAAAGLSQIEIANKLNVNRNTIRNICKRLEIKLVSMRTRPGYKTYNQKQVKCIETGIIYNSMAEAKRETGIKSIDQAVCGIIKTAGGYHWEYVDNND